MLNKNKKILSAGALCVLVAVTLTINFMTGEYAGNRKETQEVSAQESASVLQQTRAPMGELSFVAQYKDQRQETRQEETRHLETILQDEKTDDATRRAAHEQLMQLADRAEKELAIETLLEAKGFEKVAVAVQSQIVNIMVQGDALEEKQVAQILEIAMRQGGVEAENVKIIPTSQSSPKN